MKNNRLMYWNRVKFQIFVLFGLTSGLVGCNKNFTKFPFLNSNKTIHSIMNLPPVFAVSDSLLIIETVSTLDRREPNAKGSKWIPYIKIDDYYGDSTYNRTIRNLIQLKSEFKIHIINSFKNDSLYKVLMNSTFSKNYSHLDMQRISFVANTKKGVYLVVTNLVGQAESQGVGWGADGTSPSMYRSNILYEFFNVENDNVLQYSGFSLGRNYAFSKNQGGPKLKEMRWVLKNLYKQSEKYYGTNKKE